ncbi:MAG: SDR family oxidoreductase [Bacteroidota bacterium]
MFSKPRKNKFVQSYGPWGLVTGASSGIGKEISHCLASLGMHLVLTGRNLRALKALSSSLEETHGIHTDIIVADLSNIGDIEMLIHSLGDLPIGVFVASAGFGTSGLFLKSDVTEELEMLQVNNVALMMLTHHFARRFSQSGKGGIVLLSSIVGFQGVPNATNYAATKAYVQAFGEGLYHELKPYGVDVVTAAPGPVESGFAQRANMKMKNALRPQDVAWPILKALGKRAVVFPGALTKILILGLRTVPRWGKIKIMQKVMGGMTAHQPV